MKNKLTYDRMRNEPFFNANLNAFGPLFYTLVLMEINESVYSCGFQVYKLVIN